MIIISHDRKFLNNICTHIADLDYGRLDYIQVITMILCSLQHRLESDFLKTIARKEAQIKELKSFIQRFSANASKAKQATSRANQISKIQLDDIGKSSRVYPFIRFKHKRSFIIISLR